MQNFRLVTAILFLSIGLEANAFFNFGRDRDRERTPVITQRNGLVPNWAANCVTAERRGQLEDLANMNRCTSKGYTGYMDDLDYYSRIDSNGNYTFYNIDSVHVVVTDARIDYSIPDYGHCKSEMCYRAYVYINGDEHTGQHVATWVVTPGMPWRDGSGGNYTPQSLRVYQTSPKKNQNSKGDFLLQKDNEMGLAGKVYGKLPGYFVMDYYINSNNEDMPWATFFHFGIAFHASYTVNGNVGSHGCTRLKYIESKKMNLLARHVGRRFSVETRYTERRLLNTLEQEKVMLQLTPERMEEFEQFQHHNLKSTNGIEKFLFELN